MINRDPETTVASPDERPETSRMVIVDLAGAINETHIQAMTRALARVLVSRALIEHGVKPANENE